jgi:hypothetical protein
VFNKSQENSSNSLKKTSLVKLRMKAMRSGVWFKALSHIDRVLVNLTIQVANLSVHSTSLITRLLSVTNKLNGLFESRISRATREIGFPLACKFSSIAQKWGNKQAKVWATEIGFAKYLAIMKINAGFFDG